MSEIFISYARSTAAQAKAVSEALRALGYNVWRDDDLPAHRSYTDVIDERLRSAKAVVVIWSAEAVKSQWVRAEADVARQAGTLVQLSIDGAVPPLPFNQIQCADMNVWSGDTDAPGWRKVVASIGELTGTAAPDFPQAGAEEFSAKPTAPLLAVLAFDNLSGDAEMAYFSDGVSEEILQTVAQTTHLKVVGRSSSFQFRAAEKAAKNVAGALHCTHILDGAVRRSGSRVRINASLIDCANQTQLWSDRFDRDLSDVFALQDEIAASVARALNTRFAPSPVAGPLDPKAYDLYLKARTISPGWLNGRFAAWLGTYDRASLEEATSLAPNFAKAWAALAMTRAIERGADEAFEHWRDAVTSAANKAIALDPASGVSYAALGLLQPPCGHFSEIDALLDKALSLSPNDPDVLIQASLNTYKEGRIRQAQTYAARAYEVDPLYAQAECWHGMMLLQIGRQEEAYRVFDRGRSRAPQFDMLTDFPMMNAASLGDWTTVEKLKAALPAGMHRGEHAAQTTQVVALLKQCHVPETRNPMMLVAGQVRRRIVKQIMLSADRKLLRSTGTLPMSYIGFTAQIGLVGEIYDLVEKASFEGLSAPGGRHQPGDAGLQLLFERHAAPLRLDPRFPKLCARLGLCDYWVKTGRWPDCAEDNSLPYDFKAACAQLATAG